MDEHALETIELELALLVRRATSIRIDNPTVSLDRSAYLLLHQISVDGSASVKTLAEEFHLDMSTASRQTAALEKKGFITRMPDPLDGRAYTLLLTKQGAKELAEYKNARAVMISSILESWTEEECRSFGELLGKFNRSIL